jgi:hypothetical protein
LLNGDSHQHALACLPAALPLEQKDRTIKLRHIGPARVRFDFRHDHLPVLHQHIEIKGSGSVVDETFGILTLIMLDRVSEFTDGFEQALPKSLFRAIPPASPQDAEAVVNIPETGFDNMSECVKAIFRPFLSVSKFFHPFFSPFLGLREFLDPFLSALLRLREFLDPFLSPFLGLREFLDPFLSPFLRLREFLDPFLSPFLRLREFLDPFLSAFLRLRKFLDPFLSPFLRLRKFGYSLLKFAKILFGHRLPQFAVDRPESRGELARGRFVQRFRQILVELQGVDHKQTLLR